MHKYLLCTNIYYVLISTMYKYLLCTNICWGLPDPTRYERYLSIIFPDISEYRGLYKYMISGYIREYTEREYTGMFPVYSRDSQRVWASKFYLKRIRNFGAKKSKTFCAKRGFLAWKSKRKEQKRIKLGNGIKIQVWKILNVRCQSFPITKSTQNLLSIPKAPN